MGLYASLATARVSWRRVLEILDAPVDVRRSAGRAAARRRRGVSLTFDGVTLATDRDAARARRCELHGAARADRWPSSARAAPASRRSRFSRRGCSIRTRRRAPRRPRSAHAALADVRRHVVLVEQEPTLLHATIGENIRYVRPERDERRRATRGRGGRHRALRRSAAAAVRHDRRRARPGALGGRAAAHRAGARVSRQSGGARARRADRGARCHRERQVIDGYRAVMRGRTTILITHRRELAMAADRVVVLDGARVVEQGRPRSLPTARHLRALFGSTRPAAVLPKRRRNWKSLSAKWTKAAFEVTGVAAADATDRRRPWSRRCDRQRRARRASACWQASPAARHRCDGAHARRLHRPPRPWHGGDRRDSREGARRGCSPRSSVRSRAGGNGVRRWSAPRLGDPLNAQIVNLSLGTKNTDHETRSADVVRRLRQPAPIVIAAGEQAGIRWLPGSIPGVWSVIARLVGAARACWLDRLDQNGASFRASGFPRPIPGVPPERNLKGLSFAVANVTGIVARIIADGPTGDPVTAVTRAFERGFS